MSSLNTDVYRGHFEKKRKNLLALLALEHPGVGSISKGRGRGAPGDTHCINNPSLQPSATIQSEVEVAPIIMMTVMTQHVNAIT